VRTSLFPTRSGVSLCLRGWDTRSPSRRNIMGKYVRDADAKDVRDSHKRLDRYVDLPCLYSLKIASVHIGLLGEMFLCDVALSPQLGDSSPDTALNLREVVLHAARRPRVSSA
jgi:hypothetical protein